MKNQNIEKELVSIARTLLSESGHTYQHRNISLQSSLQQHLGLDSLSRAELFSRIEKKWGVQLPDRLLVEAETLGDLMGAVLQDTQNPHPNPLPSQRALRERGLEDSPLTSQKALRERGHPLQKAVNVSKAETLTEVLSLHAQQTPDKTYVFFQNEEGREETLTYGELLANALKVANAILQRGLKPGETVAIMQPTQLGFFYSFFGILLANGVPVPIYPPLRPHQLESYAKQEARILGNAEIRFLITFQQAEALSRLLKNFVPSLKEVTTVEILLKDGKPTPIPLAGKGTDIGLLQYTSGSTSTPKGVVLTHKNLLANIRAFGQAIEISPDDVAVSWLPLYHDFGLIGLVLGSLYYSVPLILMSPLTFLTRPEKWLWALHYHRGTISAAPNFAYELCVRKIDPSTLQGLDLSSWRMAANGAENIYPKTYHRFLEKFKPFGFHSEAFYPVYGLAESTVGLTTPPLRRAPRIDSIDRQIFENEKQAIPTNDTENCLDIISCGKALPHHAVRIVNDQFQELPERHVGQLQFQGPSSMQGYYNNPIATQTAHCDGWWNTGDFAYMVDGEVFIAGREKDLIIKAGRNIYPTVIEEQMCEVPGVRRGCVIAFSVSDPEKGTEQIIIVAETAEKNEQQREALRERMATAAIDALDIAPDQIILVRPKSVPKTSSGKLQRSACKAMYLEGKLKHKPVWYQMTKLAVTSFLVKCKRSLIALLKAIYTIYVILLVAIATLPLWACVKILPREKGGRICQLAAKLVRWLAFCPLIIEGQEKLTLTKPAIYAANHMSYIDAIIAAEILPVGTRFIGKKEAFGVVLLRDVVNKLQHIPIDRFDFAQGLAQTKNIEDVLKSGDSIMIFPEGTFSYAAGLRPFKLGAFKLAAETSTPICPISIQGTRHILRADNFLLRPGKIKVTIGDPIYPRGNEWLDIMHLKNEVRDFIAEHCGELSLDFT